MKKKLYFCIIFILTVVGVVIFFNNNADSNQDSQSSPITDSTNNVNTSNETLTDEKYIEQILAQMSLDEKIFQMMFVTPESITGVGQVIRAGTGTENALKKYPVGGIIYFGPNIQSRDQVIEMISNTQKYSKIPLCNAGYSFERL